MNRLNKIQKETINDSNENTNTKKSATAKDSRKSSNANESEVTEKQQLAEEKAAERLFLLNLITNKLKSVAKRKSC
jgi:hypothetical protein